MGQDCILAIDLGTTSFKAAPVNKHQVFGHPTVVRYALDYLDGGVTCPPERYYRALLRALRGAAKTAREQGLTVRGIGISSQAQTYFALDGQGEPVQPAVVWTDDRAKAEAEEAAQALPDFAHTGGFLNPSPLQFLPKVMQFKRLGGEAERFLLLNEWLIYQLTGQAYGDETNQGMSGFYDISRRGWSHPALSLAGIESKNLAKVGPAAAYHACLKPDLARALGLPSVPVYSCGNDQSVAAVGAGLEQAGDILCNFGTALVVYGLRNHPTEPAADAQIAGISPLSATSKPKWFLLGLESECGNVIDWLAKLLYPRGGVQRMLESALHSEFDPSVFPRIASIHGGRLDLTDLNVGSRAEHIARALLEFYAARFGEVLAGVRETNAKPGRLFASGGLSQSDVWLDFLSRRFSLVFRRTEIEHPGLVGVARIVAAAE